MKQDHLTVLDIEFENRVARTQVGMAFWAGTGPQGKTCRECKSYGFNGYTSSKSVNGGTLKNGPCERYVSQMGKSYRVPYDTPSCKYFEQNPKPPTITDQGNRE